ncbi:MAG: hypothetical protein A2Y02_03325 [Omnitrophica bacterium GWA2_52_12]|nr:MAG: hypothetical protein A2Y02_03325 [Omnitrophica bacterium GWA2_52_12]
MHLVYSFLIILGMLGLLASGKITKLEYSLLDIFFRARPITVDKPAIALIEIGPDSLEAIGRWPWPGHYHAEMIRILSRWNAAAIVFDRAYSDTDPLLDSALLAKALQESGRVYFPVSLENKPAKKIWVHSLPVELEAAEGSKIWNGPPAEHRLLLKGLGQMEAPADQDGILRSVQTSRAWGAQAYRYLGIQAALDYRGRKTEPPALQKAAQARQGQLLINWAGVWQRLFPRYAYAEIIRSDQAIQRGLKPVLDPKELAGKICFIGFTEGENAEYRVTPVNARMPALAVLALAAQTVLDGKYLRPAPFEFQAALMLFFGILATLVFADFRNLRSALILIGLSLAWILLSFLFFWKAGLWIYGVQPLLLAAALFIFSALYAHVVAVREQSRLFDLATRDGLTGLFVIRYFREVLNQMVQECRAEGRPLSLILMDIDNFKAINDTFGHPAGDYVLKKTAHIVQSVIRHKRPVKEADLAARYGGEEFVVMVMGKLPDAAEKVGERIREAVEKAHFDWEGKAIKVTLSVGAACLHTDEKIPDRMVRRADEALYHAKRTGKNRVCQSP